ncbi:MAG: hypothetical protein ACRCYT_02705 [Cetobacterium sp.]
MSYVKKQELKKQFKVEMFKGIQIIDNESYDLIDSRKFFPNLQDATKYVLSIKPRLEHDWVIRFFKKTEEVWELVEIIGKDKE